MNRGKRWACGLAACLLGQGTGPGACGPGGRACLSSRALRPCAMTLCNSLSLSAWVSSPIDGGNSICLPPPEQAPVKIKQDKEKRKALQTVMRGCQECTWYYSPHSAVHCCVSCSTHRKKCSEASSPGRKSRGSIWQTHSDSRLRGMETAQPAAIRSSSQEQEGISKQMQTKPREGPLPGTQADFAFSIFLF